MTTQPAPGREHWPTKAEAARRARVSVRTSGRHIKAGHLEAYPSSQGVRVNPED
jgi:hypothetical protein